MSEFLKEPSTLPLATITEDKGIRFLHLGTSWIQGAMQVAKPDVIALEYVQQMMVWMLFMEQPKCIVQLGLGSGALTKFCHRHFQNTKVTAIELNPSVISVCRKEFFLPPDNDHLQIVQMDAMDFVNNPANEGTVDILQIDLYDEFARGPVFDSPEFYKACANCLTPNGILTTNIFGDHASYEKNLHGILMAFDATAWLPRVDDENMIVIGFKRSPSIDFAALHQRAATIRLQTNLQAKTWVNGLKEWMLNA
jgi:spermidine synthase